MSDVKQTVEAAVSSDVANVKAAVASTESKVVAFVRANALKAVGISAAVGAVVGRFVL